MYCSKCGEADQNANSYCRKCGNYVNTQKPITVSLTMNIISFVVSLSLILFLMGYMAGVELAGKSAPNMFDIYLLLGANAVWQLINVIFSANLMIKMNKTSDNIHQTSEEMNAELTNLKTKDLLPPADLQSVIPSVVEETTSNLVNIRRNN